MMKGMTDEDFLSLPDMKSEKQVFAVKIMSMLTPMCCNQNREVAVPSAVSPNI